MTKTRTTRFKWLALLCAVCLVCAGLCACASAEVVVRDQAGNASVVLPDTGVAISVNPEHEKYLLFVTGSRVQRAEEEILEQLTEADGQPSFFLAVDEQGYLCLKAEVIRELDVPEGAQFLGCGVDHEHLFFEHRISSVPLA